MPRRGRNQVAESFIRIAYSVSLPPSLSLSLSLSLSFSVFPRVVRYLKFLGRDKRAGRGGAGTGWLRAANGELNNHVRPRQPQVSKGGGGRDECSNSSRISSSLLGGSTRSAILGYLKFTGVAVDKNDDKGIHPPYPPPLPLVNIGTRTTPGRRLESIERRNRSLASLQSPPFSLYLQKRARVHHRRVTAGGRRTRD